MKYIGEHTFAAHFGNATIALAFTAALLSVFAYYVASRNGKDSESWRKLARQSFIAHAAMVFTMVGVMFYLLINQYYEFDYVAEQSKNDMSLRYILVCFWGGQRGSFMLWLFWQAVLGLILIYTSKKWETHVMCVFGGIQVFLVSMLFGIYYWDDSILGINPFALKREVIPDWGTLWSKVPDYLQLDPSFKDGKGLNPLLQNYWMVIHPPTLFLGFSLVSVPFCYGIAALWKRDFKSWLKPVLPWTFVGIAILGIGILMGGAWAYESLSFGGFWAWDPVENASFVPWLTLVGAGHLMLLNKSRESSLFATFFLTVISFFLVLYSTFLTRSGVLGEESVHSFTGDGLMGQLLLFMFFFLYLGFVMMIQDKKLKTYFSGMVLVIFLIYYLFPSETALVESGDFKLTIKSILAIAGIVISIIFLYAGYQLHFPRQQKEEEISSREFWMFIGSLMLLLSAMQIIFTTSLPVINLLFDTNITKVSQEERNLFYNNWQLPFAAIVAILIGVGQFLKYKNTPAKPFLKSIITPIILAFVFTIVFSILYSFQLDMKDFLLEIFMFCSFYAVFANIYYWIKFLKGKLNFAGASVAHIGFGMILLGTIWSMGKQENLSENRQGFLLEGLNDKYSNSLDVQVFKGDTVRMKDYFLTYSGNQMDGHFLKYQTTYFSTQPNNYKKGDTVRNENKLYVSLKDHQPSENFANDAENWRPLTGIASETFLRTKNWDYLTYGEKLFDVEPFVQMHKGQNVSEPGTKHYLSHDIFTHLKDAYLAENTKDRYVRKYEIDTLVGDTIRTAGYIIATGNILPINDSVKYPDKTALTIDFTFFDIRDFNFEYPVYRKLLFVFDSTGKVDENYITIPELRMKLGLAKVALEENQHTADDGHGHGDLPPRVRYTLNIFTEDYIVLQVRKFPLILVLWVGCILMFIGTIMAVIYRVKLSQKLNKVEE